MESTEPDIEPIESDDTLKPYVRCGCGFEARGFGELASQTMLEDHACSYEYETPPTWRNCAFSFWGFLMLLLVLYGILVLTGHAEW